MKLNLSRNTIITGLIILIFFLLLAIYWKKYGIPGLGGGDQEHFGLSTTTSPNDENYWIQPVDHWRYTDYYFPSPIISYHSDKMSYICHTLYKFATDISGHPTTTTTPSNYNLYAEIISKLSELSMYPVILERKLRKKIVI